MDSLCFDQEIYKKLLPVPKTHLFMKKMVKIQAIDRQIRKKWIKIKRDNQKQHLILEDNQTIQPFTRQPIKNHAEITFMPSKDHSQINTVQNYLKRQKILSNHKRQEQIFYGRKRRTRYQSQNLNREQISSSQITLKDPINVSFNSLRRKAKTETGVKHNINEKPKSLLLNQGNTKICKVSPAKIELKKSFSVQKQVKNQVKLPKMLQKRNQHKKREIPIMTSQSQKQLIYLSQKSRQHMKQWADHRRDLFQKLKGSKAYYIMKSPTKLYQDDDKYII